MARTAPGIKQTQAEQAEGPERVETPAGTTDWEGFFEHQPHGVIPLLGRAQSRETVMRVAVLLVDSLFSREQDAERRDAFLQLVDEVVGPEAKAVDELDRAKQKLAQVFRYIKQDRQARARAFAEQQRAIDAGEAQERRAPEEELEFEEPAADEPAPGEAAAAEDDLEAVFCRVFAEVVRQRLDTLRAGNTDDESARVCSPVPFLLSEAFAEHFSGIVARDVAPLVADKAKTVIRSGAQVPVGERTAYFRREIDEYRNRRLLWEVWQVAWKEATREQEIPPRPKPEAKSALGRLKKKRTPAWKKTLTPEEWERLASDIRRANKRAVRVWAEVTAPSERYDAPQEEDNAFLMELFGRSPKALQEQINALRQIAVQGGAVGRAFDTYRRGRHPDAALLACACRFPDTFLSGKKPVLKQMLSGFLASDLQRVMPYTYRWLGGYLD